MQLHSCFEHLASVDLSSNSLRDMPRVRDMAQWEKLGF